MKLSVVLATFNEELNIKTCLKSVKGLADEIVIVDGTSTDQTVEIAKKYKALVHIVPNNPTNFHSMKQLAVDKATGDWILQLDADELLSSGLKAEIAAILEDRHPGAKPGSMPSEAIGSPQVSGNSMGSYRPDIGFQPDRNSRMTAPPAGYAIPRRNWFLGRFLTKGGVYPDPVIRFFKKGKGHFIHQEKIDNGITTSNVHGQIQVEGKIGMLKHDLIHNGDPSLDKYLKRFNRYTSLEAENLVHEGFKPSLTTGLNYLNWKPTYWFLKRYLRHRGYVDGFQGFLFALLSALHYPVIYLKAWEKTVSRDRS